MRKRGWRNSGFTCVCLCMISVAFAQEDRLSLGASVQQIWDSNYNRTPEAVSDEITVASLSVSLAQDISRQKLRARWNGQAYQHREREDLDANLTEARVGWYGEWGSRLRSELAWSRDEYLVDRLEFFDKDVVRRDDVNARLRYGTGHKLILGVGGRQSKQSHSHWLREGLNFEEDEVFVETSYSTGIKSTITARAKYGERVHPNQRFRIPPPGVDVTPEEWELLEADLDFDYQQGELELQWVASAKTQITSTLAYFNRDGEINSGSGALAGIQADWELTPKVQLTGGYQLRQPAIGETSDSPSDIHQLYFNASWQWTEKLSLAAGIKASDLRYPSGAPGPQRDEKQYEVSPLMVNFDLAEAFSLRLNTRWVDRQSPLIYRNYTSEQVSLGAFFTF